MDSNKTAQLNNSFSVSIMFLAAVAFVAAITITFIFGATETDLARWAWISLLTALAFGFGADAFFWNRNWILVGGMALVAALCMGVSLASWYQIITGDPISSLPLVSIILCLGVVYRYYRRPDPSHLMFYKVMIGMAGGILLVAGYHAVDSMLARSAWMTLLMAAGLEFVIAKTLPRKRWWVAGPAIIGFALCFGISVSLWYQVITGSPSSSLPLVGCFVALGGVSVYRSKIEPDPSAVKFYQLMTWASIAVLGVVFLLDLWWGDESRSTAVSLGVALLAAVGLGLALKFGFTGNDTPPSIE